MSHDQSSEAHRPDPSTMTEAEYQDYMADPHAFHPEHHGEHAGEEHEHHVIGKWMLRGVLAALVFFTILTVASSRAEIWIAETFELEIPTLVNVFIAMSIATIKAMLVVAVFMHLQWDNRLNLITLLFTLMGVGLFIGFTALDLGNRDTFYEWKSAQITPGGTGGLTRGEDENIAGPIYQYAKDKKIQEIGEKAYEKKLAEKHAGHGHHDDHGSSADRSRVRHGLTPGLFLAHDPDDHGGDDDETGEEHADDGDDDS
ncbi:MAG: cytochrome C oxidase subunit IV family protein [Planctomycetota bacterium]